MVVIKTKPVSLLVFFLFFYLLDHSLDGSKTSTLKRRQKRSSPARNNKTLPPPRKRKRYSIVVRKVRMVLAVLILFKKAKISQQVGVLGGGWKPIVTGPFLLHNVNPLGKVSADGR
jgi:hypothetical protein